MKKLSLYIFLVLMFCNLTNISKAKEIEAFCLVERSDLTNAKLHEGDHSRFVGKEIYLIIDYNKNIIADFSEDTAMGVITGTDGPFDDKEFEKTSNGIKYNSEIDVKGDKKDQLIKYKYNNSITIVNDKPTSLHALVDQSGWSFNSWNFQIDCRNFKYTEKEKQYAKKKQLQIGKNKYGENTPDMPEWFKPLVNKMVKEGKLKENTKKKNVKEKGNLVIDTDFDPSLIENLYEVNIDGMKKLNGEEIKILLENKRIDTFYIDYEGEHYSAEETHGVNGDFYEKSKIHGEASGKWEIQADELCYKYDKYGTVGKYKEWEADKEFICGVYVYSYYINYYFYNVIDAYVYGKIVSK